MDETTTVIARTPTRFVVVGPGAPQPKMLIASGEDISDLVGFYSIREAGLDKIVTDNYAPRTTSILAPFLKQDEPSGPPYVSVDIWEQAPGVSRKQYYSLIMDARNLPGDSKKIVDRYRGELQDLLVRLVDAVKKNDIPDVEYVAQMLATFITLLAETLQQSSSSRKARQRLYSFVLAFYIAAMFMLGLAAFVFGFLPTKFR